MDYLLKKFKENVKLYLDNTDLEIKRKYAENVFIIYIYVTSLKFNNDTLTIIKDTYNSLYNEALFQKCVNEYLIKIKPNVDKMHTFNIDDVIYLHSIIPDYSITNTCVDMSLSGFEPIKKYICGDKEYNELLNYFKNRLSYSLDYKESSLVGLNDDDIIFINTFESSNLIHEISHKLMLNGTYIYREVPSILSSIGFKSFYGIGDTHKRLELLKKFKEYDIKSLLKREDYIIHNMPYVIGILIAFSTIYRDGNSFNKVKEYIDYIICNQDKDIKSVFEDLDINKKLIKKSINSYTKILYK